MTEIINIKNIILKNIDEKTYISGQVNLEIIDNLAQNNFHLVVNNRPDGEELGQCKSIDIKKRLDIMKIDYQHLPFVGAGVSMQQILILSELLNKSNKTLIFCRSGARSALIWGLASVICLNKDIDAIMQNISNLGYDSTILPNMVEYFSNSNN